MVFREIGLKSLHLGVTAKLTKANSKGAGQSGPLLADFISRGSMLIAALRAMLAE